MAKPQKLFDLAYAAHMAGDHEAALSLYRKVIAKSSKHGDAHYLLGTLLASTGRPEEALPALQQASKYLPNSAMVKCNLGLTLKMLGKKSAAERSFREALALDPNLLQALNNLSALLIDRGCPCEAETVARRCLNLGREQAAYAHVQLANALAEQGKVDAAIEELEQASLRFPGDKIMSTNRLSFLYYSSRADNARILEAHRDAARDLRATEMAPMVGVGGRLRVGYISPDFGFHPVGMLMEPILAGHDRQRIEVFLYHDRPDCDEKASDLRRLAEHWRPIAGMPDSELYGRIRSDGIDVLVDLCGHLAGNRLPLFASRCAPVQVSYLGYPGTTGIPNMDYAISDDWLDPVGDGNADYTESLVRLERTCFAYLPPEGAPPIRGGRSESIVFGSFNNARKLAEPVLDVWARILEMLPGARLIMQARGLGEGARQEQVLGFFAARGVAADQIELHGFIAFKDYLGLISQVDICLDPWPWNGHMTTFNCLWMGVPVLSLAGDRRSARMGKAILSEIGLPEWVAESEAAYVDKAVRFAGDPGLLEALRLGMRKRLLESSLCDGRRLARLMEQAYETMNSNRGTGAGPASCGSA